MKNILVAGSTGYLGSNIVKELLAKNIGFKAIARNQKKLEQLGVQKEQMIIAEVIKPSSLEGSCKGIDVVISTVGITRQKDGLTYMDVDYQANMNLLNEAKKAGVKLFVYVSAINGDKMRHLKIMEAKEKFVDKLKESGMDYSIIRPNGFFSDMKDFLEMAKKGKVYLFGHGEFKLNPIHGIDLADFILDTIDAGAINSEQPVGGPDILTQNEIGELSLQAWKRPVKIIHLPDWVRRFLIKAMRSFTSSKTYGPIEFFLTMMATDNIAPRHGTRRLNSYFSWEVDKINREA
ncbi:SDR family oxidoreductase [Flammeovirgaceae bacterium SG7u.111]|nr:SDR family oxidoreductase [Flammeovirgaceae bacterium SG7u.132]WPO37837.1 SDR family oxidoreductase [Flammeovirgaceae bacterium SG7u.111]